MEIKEYKSYNEAEILRLYMSVDWTACTDHPEVLRKGFASSLVTLVAYEDGALCGLVRAVGDGHTVVFVQDLLVLPERQRQGVRTALLRAVLDRYSHVRQLLLMSDATPEAAAFYRSVGFQELSEAGCRGFIRM